MRTALRDALEKTGEVAASQGVFKLSEREHNGTYKRAQVMVKIDNGKWMLVK